MADNPVKLIFGPSHAVRLRHALATGQLPELPLPGRIVGVGGMPIWSPRIRRELAAGPLDHDPFFIVGDFRFGNKGLNDPAFKPVGLQPKEYLAIEKELINEENDRIMYDLCVSAIASLNAGLNGRLRLLFWDLSIRECQNRATGRYQDTGSYRHPVWNLDDMLVQFADIAIDTRDVLVHGERLYIDSSAHPSLVGWLYILKYLRGDSQVDLVKLIGTFDHSLKQLLAKTVGKDKVLITGDSKFTRLLDLFVQKGNFHLPENWLIKPLARAEAEAFDHCLYFPRLFTYEMDEAEIAAAVEKVLATRNKLMAKHKKVSVLYYDNWVNESISKRKDYFGKYVSQYDSGLTASLEAATCPAGQAYKISDSHEFEGLLELNNTAFPTTLGLLEIICRSATDMAPAQVYEAYQNLVNGCFV